MRQSKQFVVWAIGIACISFSFHNQVEAWQRPKIGEALPPLRKPSAEPQLLSPPLDAAPVSTAPGEPEEEVAVPLPPETPAAAATTAAEAPADETIGRPPSSVAIFGDDEHAPGRLPDDQSLRSIASSTLAQTATFRGVTPGKTRREELIEIWGEPLSQSTTDEQTELEYEIAPFQRVTAVVMGDVIASLVGRYETPVTLEAAAEALAVDRFTPAVIRDERGKSIGQIYPERGVLFGVAEEAGAIRVAQVVIEPPTAEGFLTRAEQHRRRNLEASLSDAKSALELAPQNARAQALLMRLLLAADRASEALTEAQTILQQQPDHIPARLISGRASLVLSRWREAERQARSVLDANSLAQIDRAAAQLLLGDVLAHSPQNDLRGAMTHHYEAAQGATAAVKDLAAAERRDALETAVDAYLAVAEDVARGNWRRREENFAQWISHTERVVETLADADVKDDWLLRIRRRALEASAASGGKIEPGPYAAAALEMGSRLVAGVSDPLRRAELQAALGISLLESSQSLMVAGRHAAGRNYIFDAQRLLEAANQQHANPRTEHLLGRAYFFRVLDKAVGESDHAAAAEWYAKAAPLLERPLPPGSLSGSAAHGQRLVTMAASLWEVEKREEALALTEKGLRYIQDAVDRGEIDRNALAAPLSNLANMNRLLGNEEKAATYETRLVDFQEPTKE